MSKRKKNQVLAGGAEALISTAKEQKLQTVGCAS